MMMNNTLKSQCKYPSGTVVIGKWHKNQYQLVRELGAGANGVVYLAKGKHGYSALKMSADNISVTSEVNVLKAFAKVQGSILGPSLFDVDDWEQGTGRHHFYVMEYIQGPDLLTFIQQNGHSWTGVMIVQLLDALEKLHKQGWVFGDLKPENLIVTGPPPSIRFIDVGGTTLNGRSIKEFTEFFDRGYWGLGSRKAEPAYDLFSTAMMMINLYYPNRFVKKGDGNKQLIEMIRSKQGLNLFINPLRKALLGKYLSAHEMREEILGVLSGESQDINKAKDTAKPKQRYQPKKKGSSLETAAILLLTSILYAVYMYGYLL